MLRFLLLLVVVAFVIAVWAFAAVLTLVALAAMAIYQALTRLANRRRDP